MNANGYVKKENKMEISLPHNREAEESVICSLILGGPTSDRLAGVAAETLSGEDFYEFKMGIIFDSVMRLFAAGVPADIVTVGQDLRKHGQIERVGGLPELGRLMEWVPVSINFPHHCQVLKKFSELRRYWAAAQKISQLCLDPNVEPIEVKEAADAAFVLPEREGAATGFNVGALANEVAEQTFDPKQKNRGLRTPWAKFNTYTNGLQPQNLVILAARPSVGKSALAINLAEAVSCSGRPVAFFSLEMSGCEVARRILASRIGVSATDILAGDLNEVKAEGLKGAATLFSKVPLYIEDQGNLSVPLIRAKSMRIKAEHGLSLVVVDYLQMVSVPKGERRDLDVSMITRGLKQLAKELDVPVLALSQLNRKIEGREKKQPMLSDLRESGAIENDADAVIFLYRQDDERGAYRHVGLDIAKYRNGEPQTINMLFEGKTTTFTEAK